MFGVKGLLDKDYQSKTDTTKKKVWSLNNNNIDGWFSSLIIITD